MPQNARLESLSNAPSSRTQSRKPPQPPTHGINKPQSSRRHVSKQASELKTRLESSVTIAADGITSLTNNITARQTTPELVKDRQLTLYINRLRAVSEDLKSQLRNMGNCSKLSNRHDHQSFDASYRRILALWKEYQRVSGCVVQHARSWRQCRKESTASVTEECSGSSALSSSSGESDQVMVDGPRE